MFFTYPTRITDVCLLTESLPALFIMVIELSGVQFGLKSYAWFEITSMISDQNCTTRGSITTLLHPFWNRPNTGLGQFKYFINAILSRFEIKFIQFLGGKNKSLGNKSCKICHSILFVFHFPAIWSFTLNKPWNLSVCFVFSVASSLAGKSQSDYRDHQWFPSK